MTQQQKPSPLSFRSRLAAGAAAIVLLAAGGSAFAATTPLSDTPVRATAKVPANVMLALSVEWPTGDVQAYNDEVNAICPGRGNADATTVAANSATSGSSDSVCYFAARTYIGYFDPFKCYTYSATDQYFSPAGYTIGASVMLPTGGSKTCSGQWSGNYLNWATMQTTDMFRWAMTGGDRFIDTATLTVLEKARHDRNTFSQTPIKRIGGGNVGTGPVVQPVLPSTVTPYSSGTLFLRINNLNTVMWVSKARGAVTPNRAPTNDNNPLNDLVVPPASVQTFTEEGLCATYVGMGMCTQVATSNTGTRQITGAVPSVDEPGQCPVGGSVSCVDTAAPVVGTRSYQYTRTAAGLACPSGDANQTSCTQTSVGTRTAVISETGQCPFPTAPAGTTYSGCTNTVVQTSTVTRLETGTASCASVTNPAGTVLVSCTPGSTGSRGATRTEAGPCPFPAPPVGTTFSNCTNPTVTTSNVTRIESGFATCVGVTNPAGTTFISCSLIAGMRGYTRTEAGACPFGVAPVGTTYSSCTNPTVNTSTVTRIEAGFTSCLGVTNPAGTTFVSCSPTAATPGTRRYTRTETGTCTPTPPVGTTYTSCSQDTSARLAVYEENGQCVPFTPPTGFVSCTNFSGTRRRVTVIEGSSCPRVVGGQTTISCSTITSRVYTVTEPGQCPTGAAPANTIFGACSNITAPTAAFRTVVRTEPGTCPALSATITACSVASVVTRRYNVSEPGQCPTAAPPVGVTFGACTNTVAPSRAVVRTEPGTCPALSATVTACSPLGVVTRRYDFVEPGQCPLGTPPAGVTFGTCSNVGVPNRTIIRTENGSCSSVAAGFTSCGAGVAGTRRYTSLEPGECPRPAVAGITVNSCTQTTLPLITVAATSAGNCPATIPAGGTLVAGSCTNGVLATIGTRTVVRNVVSVEADQCATYVGSGTCINLTAPITTSIRSITGETVQAEAFRVRVKVCDSSLPETQTTCTLYSNGTSLKPTGTIQDNALTMRFGAFGYLLDTTVNNITRDGGVLRAKMKDVGPSKAVPQNTPTANSAGEWSAVDGTYVNNPDAADATATGLGATNSGVINYLNRYGRAGGYKGFDPIGEMYAEVVKYFKQGRSPTADYISGLDATMVDGFPVIATWNDPIQYSCQQNFVIMIADANSHKDKNLSGGVVAVENEPATLPAGIDTDYNVTTWTNAVGAIEGAVAPIPRAGGPATPTTFTNDLANLRNCCNGSAFIAGLAYYAHTTDLRADFDNLNGIQKLTSFFVDVREAGSWGTTGDPRNQMWMAAKYGGFKDINENNVFDSLDTWADASQGTVQGYSVPKNYFAANQPEKLVAGLQSAFREIIGQSGSGAGVGVAASNLSQTTGENGIYQVKFDTKDWSGTVTGFTINNIDATTGAIALNAPAFESGALLFTKAAGAGWDTSRVVVTAVPGSTPLGQPFRFANLNATQKAALGPDAADQEDVVNYIRGQKTKEETSPSGVPIAGGKYRTRSKLLADIVDSEAVFVGAPKGEYLDEFNPGYSAFKTAKAGRTPMIYVGANAGQLHGFNAIVNPLDPNFVDAGKEVMAFVPSLTYVGPNNTPAVDGLRSLTSTTSTYAHHYFINSTPSTRDVDFNQTSGNMTTTPEWRTILVGGMGKGGRGFFALDVTDPADFATEAAAASKVLWEFSDADMGYSFALPLITKTRKWGWVVLVTSGYNNITTTVTADKGKGFLYVLSARTGALLQKITTGVGTATDPSGFSPLSAYTPSFADYTTDEAYGGDLMGNVWRFDFRDPLLDVPDPLLFATLKDDGGVAQPITTIPLIEYATSDSKRYVFVGTGRFLDQTDIQNANQQSFYAIRDGSIGQRFETTASTTGEALPSGASFPITRSQLFGHTDLVTGLTPAQIATKPMGWYYNMLGRVPATGTVLARERISLNPKASQGFVTWVGNVPEANACNPDGTSSQYATTYGGGKSVLYTTDTAGVKTYVASITTAALVKSQLVNLGDGVRILGTDATGKPFLIGNPLNAFGSGRLLNWREILQ